MLRLLVLLLLLANGAYLAWSQGLLRAYGLAPMPLSEPQRVAQQIRPEALQLLTPEEARRLEAPPLLPVRPAECLQAGLFNEEQTVVLRDRLQSTLPVNSWVLENIVETRNIQAKDYEKRRRYGPFTEEMDLNYRKFALSRWDLNGPPQTWRSQLEEYYRKEPVFALIGGISASDWQPVHEFSEQNKIPCIFPVTDLPVISETDWYTLYFSKGVYQEGEAAARFLARTPNLTKGKVVVQVMEDSQRARALGAGFQSTWQELGQHAPVNITLPEGGGPSIETIHKLTDKEEPVVVLLWIGSGTIQAVESILAASKQPAVVFVSSSLLKQSLWELPEQARENTYITYPYRLSDENERQPDFARAWLQSRKFPISDSRISTRMYSLINLMSETFMHLKRNFYRDYLLDTIGMLTDKGNPDYERLSFGPGQRYSSKGCYIVQLSPGQKPKMIKKSDWVLY